MGAHCSKTESTSYYVVMRDYPKLGKEAVVWPETTRSDVIERIKSGEYDRIVSIHYIDTDSMTVTDVKAELMDDAEKSVRYEEKNRQDQMFCDRESRDRN
jgi:hypothetical protein